MAVQRQQYNRKGMEGVAGGRRITVSPRPCSGRRVLAKKRGRRAVDGFVNSVKKLQRREICSKRDRAFTITDAQERFRNIRLQVPSLLCLFTNLFIACMLWFLGYILIGNSSTSC